MTNKNIFCNTPWYELHVYWDGSLGICCQEDHKLYDHNNKQYNIANMSIADWFNSQPAKQFRAQILGDQKLSECRQCYLEEKHGGHSRRLKSNQKSVIFTRTAFDESFEQSPGYTKFMFSQQNQGETVTQPIDLHLDLGNYCNLACKMCNPQASSTIAAQLIKWGDKTAKQYLGNDWTKDNKVWTRVKQELVALPQLNNIHFMGGETLLTDRLEDLVDTMIKHKRFDVCFSFVTNGTIFNAKLLDKLKKFQRVGLEISLETVDNHNSYQRQGTDTDKVLANIARYKEWCNGSSITVSLRPAPSILSIGYYVSLLEYALENQFIIKSNLCYEPRFLHTEILPTKIKKQYAKKYETFLEKLNDVATDNDYNASDPNNYRQIIKEQAEMCLNLLNTPAPKDSAKQLELMVRHCEKWDRVYGYDAKKLYPEFADILKKYDYNISSKT